MTVFAKMQGLTRRCVVVTEFNPNHKDKWAAWFGGIGDDTSPPDPVTFGATEVEAVSRLYELIEPRRLVSG